MGGRAIPTRAGRQCPKQINFRKEFDVVARAHWAGFHKVLARIAGKTSAHENIHHIMHKRLGLSPAEAREARKGTGQVRVAAVVVGLAR